MLRIPVNYDLVCQVPMEREYCREKAPHCYIIRDSKVVATVYINPISIEKGADLLEYEREDVITVVRENEYEIEEAYRRVVNGW